MSNWIKHVKEYQKENGLTYKEALQQASKSYSGGSLKSNYIRNIIYKNDFDVNKMKNPSNYIVKKFKAPKEVKKSTKNPFKSEREEKNFKKKLKENIALEKLKEDKTDTESDLKTFYDTNTFTLYTGLKKVFNDKKIVLKLPIISVNHENILKILNQTKISVKTLLNASNMNGGNIHRRINFKLN